MSATITKKVKRSFDFVELNQKHKMRNFIKAFVVALLLLSAAGMMAVERTILIGPKTIGAGWKDNIVLEPRHFQQAQSGDVLTVYTDNAKRSAQGAFQDPKGWQAIAPEYAYFAVSGPFRMTLTADIIVKAKERGVAIGGHDYRITYVTLCSASDYQETIVWKGPAVDMKSDWSSNAAIPAKCLQGLSVGDAMKFHVSKVKQGTAIKVMDFTWNEMGMLSPSPIGKGRGEATYYINDDAPLIKIQLAGGGDNVALRIGGKDYRLESLGIVKFVGERSDDLSQAQHAPKEYKLQPGELFHGEKLFPADYSGNLRISAEPFQDCTENDVVVVSLSLPPSKGGGNAKSSDSNGTASSPSPVGEGRGGVISFRENHGKWLNLSGSAEPQLQQLDGNDVVLTFDAASLDKVKTHGLVITGCGFTLTRVQLLKVE